MVSAAYGTIRYIKCVFLAFRFSKILCISQKRAFLRNIIYPFIAPFCCVSNIAVFDSSARSFSLLATRSKTDEKVSQMA